MPEQAGIGPHGFLQIMNEDFDAIIFVARHLSKSFTGIRFRDDWHSIVKHCGGSSRAENQPSPA